MAGTSMEGVVTVAAALTRKRPTLEPRSILVLRNNDVGDLLATTPLFDALRRTQPAAKIYAGIGDWNRAVLQHNPHVDEVVSINAPWFNKYARGRGALAKIAYLAKSTEARRISAQRFDVGIDVLGSAWGSLLLLRAGIPIRLGMKGYAGGHSGAQFTVQFDPQEHVARSGLRFAELLGATPTDLPAARPQIFLTPAERAAAEHWWAAVDPTAAAAPRVVIAPGGGVAARRWPADRFAALCRALVAETGPGNVLVLGGPGESDLVSEVARAGAPSTRVPPQTLTLREAFALLAKADFVICNSSMPLHAAAAFAIPTLVVLGAGFPSASQHQAQWGYATTISLGKEAGRRAHIYEATEVFACAREQLASLSTRRAMVHHLRAAVDDRRAKNHGRTTGPR